MMGFESSWFVIAILTITVTCCCGLAPAPTNVDVSCVNFNCTLIWDEPDNVTSSDVITYTVEDDDILGVENITFIEISDCVNIQQTECNLVSIIALDSLANIHSVVVSSTVNGERSERIDDQFTPNWKATLDHPDVALIPPVEPTSFTVHIHAPLSPYTDLDTGELMRVDELPPFTKKGFFASSKHKFKHSSVLYLVQPNNTLVVVQEESDYVLDKELVFADLIPYTRYRLEVTSGLGRLFGTSQSKDAAVLLVTTPEDVPSEGPIITDIVRMLANCSSPDVSPVIISWKPPPREKTNGLITHFSIKYMYPGNDFSLATVKNCTLWENSMELQLQRWQAYEFAVRVCNSVGCAESDHKTLFNIQALRKGSKTTNISVDLTDDHPLVISWQPPGNFTECISSYLVTVHLGARTTKPVVREMVFTTYLQINETLPPGTYVVVVHSFIRSGFESATAGEEASKHFMIEDKTVTNHLILPLVITFSFVFSAILVGIVICAKWFLRPFDFQLEKTRAMKIAREFQARPVHYHNTEHEVYDALPGSRRSSKTSITSRRPSRSSNPRLFLRTDSSSSVGNRLASHGEPPSRLTSHVEEPSEEDTLLDVMYSPISARKMKKLECSDHQLPPSREMRPLLGGNGGSILNDGGRYPMLTIEIRRDSNSPRVVRWQAGGYDGVDENDPFDSPNADDLPKADDFNDAIASRTSGVANNPTRTESKTHTSSSSDKSNDHAASESSVTYSNLPSLSSESSSSSSNSQKGLNYATLAAQNSTSSSNSQRGLNYARMASQNSESSEADRSSTNSQRGLNYATLASQNSESSDAGGVPIINVINPALFGPVVEEDDNQDGENSGGIQYSQLANAQPSNLSTDVPISQDTAGGYIHPYSRIANSANGTDGESVPPNTRVDDADGYHQLARADPQGLPQVREERTDSSASQQYVQLSSCNSPSPSLPRAATNRTYISDSRSDTNTDSQVSAAQKTGEGGSDSMPTTQNGLQSPRVGNLSPTSCDADSDNKTASYKPPKAPSEKQSNADNGAVESKSPNSLSHYTPMSNLTVSSPPLQNSTGGASPNMQLSTHSPCTSPQSRTRRIDRAEPGYLYRSVRVPPVHAAPGSPLLPSRALDIRNSDSEDSSLNYSHESLDSVGETHASNGARNIHRDNHAYSTSLNGAEESKRNLDCESESSAEENSIPEMCVQESPSVSHTDVRDEGIEEGEKSSEEGVLKVERTAPPNNALSNGGYVMRT